MRMRSSARAKSVATFPRCPNKDTFLARGNLTFSKFNSEEQKDVWNVFWLVSVGTRMRESSSDVSKNIV